MSNTNINQLQSYIQEKSKQYITLTKPGYEIRFYSRFNSTAKITDDITTPPKAPSTKSVKHLDTDTIIPNAILTSKVDRNSDVAAVQSINVRNTVGQGAVPQCELQIINPDGVNYFLPTIGTYGKNAPSKGHSNSTTDYDYSYNNPISNQRIGTMDTVIVKLTNSRINSVNGTVEDYSEVVFRGCIKTIRRTSTPTGGSFLSITLGDFSEFMRMATALPLGIFSTISFSLTGRGLVNNLVKYTNRLYTGDWRFLGVDYANIGGAAVANTILPNSDSSTSATTDGNIFNSSLLGDPSNHAMAVPPFFYLEYSDLIPDIFNSSDFNKIVSLNQGQTNSSSNPNDTTNNSDINNITGSVISSLANNATNFLVKSLLQQTPEDEDTLQYYNVALSQDNPDIQKYSKATDISVNVIKFLEKYAWVLSDLYLETGLISFEHQKIWPTMTTAAERSMREVYFDIAPKLSLIGSNKQGPTSPYDTASVPEIKASEKGGRDKKLPDIHPNIGILKYRLSPCLRPYSEGKDTSYVFQYNIKNSEIISDALTETEEEVYTAVFGFGSVLDKTNIQKNSAEILAGQNRGILGFAQSISPQIERRLGYRFMSEHNMTIKIPILMYLTSYVILMQSEMNMFVAEIKVIGNPKYKPGSIVRLQDRNIDYYCWDVQHHWSLDGYITVLNLSHGHTSGILPAPLTGGSYNDNIMSNAICAQRSNSLEPFISSKTIIGDVNVQCLIYAMWLYMTCGASTDEQLKQATPEYENSVPQSFSYKEWINANGWNDNTKETRNNPPPGYSGPLISSYNSQIYQALVASGLDKYNLTVNAVKNLIALESNWVADAYNAGGPAYGWFQLVNKQNQISNQDAINNFPAALNVALDTLSFFFKVACNNNPNNSVGKSYLSAFAGYNSGTANAQANNWNAPSDGSSTPYVYLVFGPEQANAIALNNQLPANGISKNILSNIVCQKQTPGLQPWPYPVYGPIGMRLDAYKSYFGGNDSQAKTVLTSFDSGMQISVNYITSLLNKYLNNPLPLAGSTGSPGYVIKADSLIQKVIGAWYSNENIASLNVNDAQFLKTAIDGITSKYYECQNCTGNMGTAPTKADNTVNLAASQISWRIPVDNPVLTSGYKHRNGTFHYGCDWANSATPANSLDPVYAPADGVVIYAQPGVDYSGDGGSIVILHGNPANGVISRFFDLGANSFLVSQGQSVIQGQQIATMASAGPGGEAYSAVGSHCHHEIHIGANVSVNGNSYTWNDNSLSAINKTAVNPLTYLGSLPYTTEPGALTPS